MFVIIIVAYATFNAFTIFIENIYHLPFRTILAALHFNYNLNRDSLKDDQGNPKLRVTYVKYKYGEGTVREAKTAQNFGKIVSWCLKY